VFSRRSKRSLKQAFNIAASNLGQTWTRLRGDRRWGALAGVDRGAQFDDELAHNRAVAHNRQQKSRRIDATQC